MQAPGTKDKLVSADGKPAVCGMVGVRTDVAFRSWAQRHSLDSALVHPNPRNPPTAGKGGKPATATADCGKVFQHAYVLAHRSQC